MKKGSLDCKIVRGCGTFKLFYYFVVQSWDGYLYYRESYDVLGWRPNDNEYGLACYVEIWNKVFAKSFGKLKPGQYMEVRINEM